jgi:hypothetical protein
VQEDDDRAIGRTRFGVGHIQHAGIDLLQRTERDVGPGLDLDQLRAGGLCARRDQHSELGGCGGERRGTEKAAAIVVDVFDLAERIHGLSPISLD